MTNNSEHGTAGSQAPEWVDATDTCAEPGSSTEEQKPCSKANNALVDRYILNQTKRGLYSKASLRSYASDLSLFARFCNQNSWDIARVSRFDVRAFLAQRTSDGVSHATLNRLLSTLRGFYAWLCDEKRCALDPTLSLRAPKIARHLPHTLKHQQLDRLLDGTSTMNNAASSDLFASAPAAASEGTPAPVSVSVPKPPTARRPYKEALELRNRALLEFMYACGARISEVSLLKLSQLDLRERCVRLWGKGNKERIVPLHDTCIKVLEMYLDSARPVLLQQHHAPYVFVTASGSHISTDQIRNIFARSVRNAGVQEHTTPHDMRHTFASDLLEGGADLRSVQEMLGHASLSTTQIYTHLSFEHLKAVQHKAHPRG